MSYIMAAEIVIANYNVGKARLWSLLGWFNMKWNIRQVGDIFSYSFNPFPIDKFYTLPN